MANRNYRGFRFGRQGVHSPELILPPETPCEKHTELNLILDILLCDL